jgi:hypothetical protein
MPNVDVERARQLVRASALAYEDGIPAIRASPHFSGSGLIDNPGLKQVPATPAGRIGIDSALIGQTPFGVVLAFRGTLAPILGSPDDAVPVVLDWLNDADLAPTAVPYSAGKVHHGFRRSLDALWGAKTLLEEIRSAAEGGRPIFVTGHSKGGALATLAARRLAAAGVTPSGVMTFGAPRAGDEAFAADYGARVDRHWRFEHQDDVVPHLPPGPMLLRALRALPLLSGFLREHVQGPVSHYAHVGRLCFLDWNNALDEGDSVLLALEREAHLIVAGPQLITDHFIDAARSPAGTIGYVEALDRT